MIFQTKEFVMCGYVFAIYSNRYGHDYESSGEWLLRFLIGVTVVSSVLERLREMSICLCGRSMRMCSNI